MPSLNGKTRAKTPYHSDEQRCYHERSMLVAVVFDYREDNIIVAHLGVVMNHVIVADMLCKTSCFCHMLSFML